MISFKSALPCFPNLQGLILVTIIAGGCSPDGKGLGGVIDQVGTDTDTADAGGFISVSSCENASAAFTNVMTSVTDVPTVLDVRWSGDALGPVYVLFGVDADHLMRTNAVTATIGTYEVLLRGVPAHSVVHYRLVSADDGASACSEEYAAETGGLNADLPSMTFEGTPGDPGDFALTGLITPDQSYAAIFDANGDYVWATELEFTVWRTRLSLDHEAVLVNDHADTLEDDGYIYRIAFDGSRQTLWSKLGLHTDFVELPDGTLAGFVWDVRHVTFDGVDYRVAGDALVEHSPDGAIRTVWDSFDWFTPTTDTPYHSFTGDDAAVIDWTHANGISYDPVTDTYYISIAGIQAVAAVVRTTGEQLWAVSDRGGTITPTEHNLILNPHSFYHVSDDHYVVFDRNDPGSTECSEATGLLIDEAAATASEEWTYASPDCLNVYYMGEAHPLTDGGLLISWTTSGRLERLAADHSSSWTLTAALGAAVGFNDESTSLYPSDDDSGTDTAP